MITYRILRVLEYEGSLEWITRQMELRGVKGTHKVMDGIIREGIIGDPVLLLDNANDVNDEDIES
jgi:hypothetical protein